MEVVVVQLEQDLVPLVLGSSSVSPQDPSPRPRRGGAVSFAPMGDNSVKVTPTPVVDPSAEVIRTELLAGVLGAPGIDVESLEGQFRPPPAPAVPTPVARRGLGRSRWVLEPEDFPGGGNHKGGVQ